MEGGELINIEMQCFHQKNFCERVLFYWAKLFTRQIKSGAKYNKLRPAYSLIFTDYTLFKDLKKCCSAFSLKCDEQPEVVFSEHLQLVLVELNKFKKCINISKLDNKELWMYLLKRSSHLTAEEIRHIASRSKVMKQALDKLDYLSKEQRAQIVADFSQKAHLDELARIDYAEEKGIEKGIKQGKLEGKLETASSMLKKNLDIKLISEVTGLSTAEIEKLKNGS